MTMTQLPPSAPPPPGEASASDNAGPAMVWRPPNGSPAASLLRELRQGWKELPLPAMVAAWATLTLSALALWALLFVYVFSGLQQQRTNSVLYSQFRQELTAEQTVAPIGGIITPGAPVALIEAPIDGLRSMVIVEGTSSGNLMDGPGHKRDTPLPGQPGTSEIYGRSVSYGAPFANIDQLRRGQKIKVTTGQGVFTYLVEGKRKPGDPKPYMLGVGGIGKSRMSLITSAGSSIAPTDTLIVDTIIDGDPQPAPRGRPTNIPGDETAMKGDTSQVVEVVLWLEALILVAGGIVWARVRWGKKQAWVVGVPVLLATLWLTSNSVMLALPNLI